MSLVACPLKIAAFVNPKNIAIVSGNIYWTFLEWDSHVNQISHFLQDKCIYSQDRVAICGDNSVAYVSLVLALHRLEAVVCPISKRYTESQREKILGHLKCKEVFDQSDLNELSDNIKNYPKDYLGIPIDDTFLATIIGTSGSMGDPKWVAHTLRSHYFSALGVNNILDLDEESGWALTLPLDHIGGLAILFRCVQARATLVISIEEQPLSEVLTMEEVSHVSLVPTQLYRLLKNKKAIAALENLYAVIVGGAPLPEGLLKEAKKIPVHTTYGLTEMASQVTTSADNIRDEYLDHSGEILDYREVYIDNDGEICVKGDTLCSGYWIDGVVKRSFDEEGWFHTGDLGRWSAENKLIVIGRKDKMFISGGENIHPEEIENALLSLQGIEEALVVSKEDKEFGKRPIAYIKSDQEWSQANLKEALSKILEKFKIPDEVLPWADLTIPTMAVS